MNLCAACRVVFLSASLVMLQQLSGINALIYYSTAVFGAAGLTSPVLGTVLLAVVNLLGAQSICNANATAALLSSRNELLAVRHIVNECLMLFLGTLYAGSIMASR